MMRSTSAFDAGGGVDDQEDQIGILRACPCRRDHRAVEAAAGFEDARRVDKEDLRLALDRNAHQPGPRGLGLWADDRDLLTD